MMFEVRPYVESDYSEIEKWGKGWGSSYKKELFPPIGLIVPGYAVYFLYETPSKVCFLESLISNPEANKEEMRLSLDQLITEMFKLAKSRGFEVAYACTNNTSVVERAIRLGCNVQPKYALMQKDLTK